MEPIEEQLKQALGRVDPPDRFAARVMAQVAVQREATPRSSGKACFGWFAWWWHWTRQPVPAVAMALMILVVLGLGLGHWGRQPPRRFSEQEQMAGRQASAQLVLALEITSAQLSRMHALLSQASPAGPLPGDQDTQPRLRQ